MLLTAKTITATFAVSARAARMGSPGSGSTVGFRHRRCRVFQGHRGIIGTRRHRGIPLEERASQLLKFSRLAITHVGALALVAREIEQKLGPVDGQVFPNARANRALVAKDHPPVEISF